MDYESSADLLEVTVRVTNVLRASGMVTIGDVVDHCESEMMSIPNFGIKSLRNLTEELARHGLRLRKENELRGGNFRRKTKDSNFITEDYT
jgi:DNA-directed RNA polymerase alpha subunit